MSVWGSGFSGLRKVARGGGGTAVPELVCARAAQWSSTVEARRRQTTVTIWVKVGVGGWGRQQRHGEALLAAETEVLGFLRI